MAKMLHFGTKTVDSTVDFTVSTVGFTVGMRGYSQMVPNNFPRFSTFSLVSILAHPAPRTPTAGYSTRPLQRGIVMFVERTLWVYVVVYIV